jgi:hypothetical protein
MQVFEDEKWHRTRLRNGTEEGGKRKTEAQKQDG